MFNEDFDRIFECFINKNISFGYIFKDLISNVEFIKEDHLDKANTEFNIEWKNYYKIKFIVEKIIKEKFYKSLILRAINIDKLPIQINVLFNFYLDNIEEKIIFIIEVIFQDIFFKDLIKSDFNEEDKLNICKNIENYLSTSLKGLERIYSSLMNNISLEEAWRYVSHPKLFLEISSKDMIYILKDEQINMNSPVELYTKPNNSPNFISLTTLIIKTMRICDFYSEVSFITIKNQNFPSIQLTIKLQKIDNNNCFCSFIIKPLESLLSYPMYCKVFKFWEKRAIEFLQFFEKKSTKNKSK